MRICSPPKVELETKEMNISEQNEIVAFKRKKVGCEWAFEGFTTIPLVNLSEQVSKLKKWRISVVVCFR